jgi:hypothetical protein
MTGLARLFADIDAGAPPEPAPPPGYVEATLVRARRSVRRRRAAGAAVAALAVLAAVVVVPWPGRVLDAAPAAPTGPTLPAEFAAYSALTSAVPDSPPGRAIALYEFGSSELFTSWQTLVAGADRDTYRRVDVGVREQFDPTGTRLLSPDGTRVLLYDYPSTFVLLDLTTGATTRMAGLDWTGDVEVSIRLLAWSPDGRTVAYGVPVPLPGDDAASSYFAGRPALDLVLLDLRDGSSTRVPGSGPVWAAAYSPDGRTLALQRGPGHAWLATPEGTRLRELDLNGDHDLAPGVAFSPDGALLATLSPAEPDGPALGFVDATGGGRAVPRPLPYDNVLGWRTPTSVVVQTWSDELDAEVLAEVSIWDGAVTVLSRFSRARVCEYLLQRCYAYRIQLASALLPGATIRPADPDRGPWPRWMWLTLAGATLIAVAAVTVIRTVRRRGRRRRR